MLIKIARNATASDGDSFTDPRPPQQFRASLRLVPGPLHCTCGSRESRSLDPYRGNVGTFYTQLFPLSSPWPDTCSTMSVVLAVVRRDYLRVPEICRARRVGARFRSVA